MSNIWIKESSCYEGEGQKVVTESGVRNGINKCYVELSHRVQKITLVAAAYYGLVNVTNAYQIFAGFLRITVAISDSG